MDYKKQSYSKLEDRISKYKKELSAMNTHLYYKQFSRIVVEDHEYRKFKKYAPAKILMIIARWDEDFVDEDNGEVVTIERGITLGILQKGVAYRDYKIHLGEGYYAKGSKPCDILLEYISEKDIELSNNY